MKTYLKASIQSMSKGCFDQIFNYILNNGGLNLVGKTKEETVKNINNLAYFQAGCFTAIQADLFGEFFHNHKQNNLSREV